jgi:hypothetical protein
MHNQFKMYCSVAYTPLNMFRTLLSRPQLEARQTRQSYGNQWLQRQLEGATDDGHNSARNMLSGIYATKQKISNWLCI